MGLDSEEIVLNSIYKKKQFMRDFDACLTQKQIANRKDMWEQTKNGEKIKELLNLTSDDYGLVRGGDGSPVEDNHNFWGGYNESSNTLLFKSAMKQPLDNRVKFFKSIYDTDTSSQFHPSMLEYILHWDTEKILTSFEERAEIFDVEKERVKYYDTVYKKGSFANETKGVFPFVIQSLKNVRGQVLEEMQRPIIALYAQPNIRMARFLNLTPNTPIILAYIGFVYVSPFILNEKAHPRFVRVEVDSLFIYSDIVEKSRVGSLSTNLLEVVPLNQNKMVNKKSPVTVFKRLAKLNLDSVSIRIADPWGVPIAFPDDSFTGVQLVIQPR